MCGQSRSRDRGDKKGCVESVLHTWVISEFTIFRRQITCSGCVVFEQKDKVQQHGSAYAGEGSLKLQLKIAQEMLQVRHGDDLVLKLPMQLHDTPADSLDLNNPRDGLLSMFRSLYPKVLGELVIAEPVLGAIHLSTERWTNAAGVQRAVWDWGHVVAGEGAKGADGDNRPEKMLTEC